MPVLAHVFQKITILDQNPDSAMQDWVDVIETDPLSSAQVIRRARSPAYGFQGEINQVDKAVILLGKDEVKQIVVAGAVKRSLEKVTEKGFSIDAYWVHSVAVAITARLLSFPMDMGQWSPDEKKRFDDLALEDDVVAALIDCSLWSRFELKEGEDPFVGGIMHDVGKVILAHAYPGLFPVVLEELGKQKWKVPMGIIEAEFTGGSDHCVVGGVLATDWDLGEATSAAISQHHSSLPTSNLARLVEVADFVATTLFPFPAEAKYPHVEVVAALLAEKSLEDRAKIEIPENLAPFLADSVADSLKTGRSELIQLACRIAPAIRRLVHDVQNSV
ncbi:MAG: HDOD domain-containing protein [Gemmatimonadetes bacterium]|nr:HDOD domain-containing protein [Gemmatimonadota bacterium]